DRHPTVDVAGRLVYITARTDDLTGLQNLPRAGKIERMDLSSVAVEADDGTGLEPQKESARIFVLPAAQNFEAEAGADGLPGERIVVDHALLVARQLDL